MKVLFDGNTPAPLARALRGHEIVKAQDLGWQQLCNGPLLDCAEEHGFGVLVTCDQNIRYQQNFHRRRIAVVILSTNHWQLLRAVASRIATIVDFVTPGEVVRVDVAELGRR
jgi:hypothetical protein